MYRRPLPTTNVAFLSTVMWDGRENTGQGLAADLKSQARDATLGHAQAANSPTDAQLNEIVSFQLGIFTAQIFDHKAKFLTGDNAKGGPIALASQEFFIGINDPLGLNPKGTPFTSQIFNLYRPWLDADHRPDYRDLGMPVANVAELFKSINISDDWRRNDHEHGMINEHRCSVARGEELFNNTKISITGVAGLNDDLNIETIPGFCGTCQTPRTSDTTRSRRHLISAFPMPARKLRQSSTLLACRSSQSPASSKTVRSPERSIK